jgi:TRAP-type C4-dicarboxylate transport system permease small subunit
MGAGLLIATQSFSRAMFLKDMDLKSPMLKIPRYPFLLISAFGFALLFLAALIHLYNTNKKSNFETEISPVSEKNIDSNA